MTETEITFEARLQTVVRQVLDTRIDLLSIMMSEVGIDAATTRARLTTLVHALQNPRLEDTIFESGRRMAMIVDGDVIVMNRELLGRVGDAEVLTALARPVAEITQLASVGVSLAFQIDDEQLLRDLTMKAQRRADGEVVRASSIHDWVRYRIQTLAERLGRLCGELGGAGAFDASGSDEVCAKVETSPVWPEWSDVAGIAWCQSTVAQLTDALAGTTYQSHAGTLAELMWDSVVLSLQSFMRHAGRTARTLATQLDIGELLNAIANAASGDERFSTDVAEWPAYQDVYDAWRDLNHHERAVFGPVLLNDKTPPASVVVPARLAFGLDEPKELPWAAPLVCWTTREQRALRDLLMGFIKTLPGHTEHALQRHTLVKVGDEPALVTSGDRLMLAVHMVPLGIDATLMEPESPSRTWSACVRQVVEQFVRADDETQESALASLRAAYDQLFPESRPIWARRFFDLGGADDVETLVRLVTAINNVFSAPIFFDPFAQPTGIDLAPLATLVLPVGIVSGTVSFFVPVVAVTATLNGAPVRIRAVEVPAGIDAPCRWLCDRAIHLESLGQQSVELITRSVRGDAIQMALVES